jgi:hypothetical protein
MVEPYHTGRVQEPKPTQLIPRTHTPSLVNDGNCSTVVPLRSTYRCWEVSIPQATVPASTWIDVNTGTTSDLKPVFDELQQRLVEVLNFFSLLSVFERT